MDVACYLDVDMNIKICCTAEISTERLFCVETVITDIKEFMFEVAPNNWLITAVKSTIYLQFFRTTSSVIVM